MTTAIIKNQVWNRETQETTYKDVTVKVGDYVGFKSDVEQSGKITKIEPRGSSDWVLTLRQEYEGFEGGYIGGLNETTMFASDCWTE